MEEAEKRGKGQSDPEQCGHGLRPGKCQRRKSTQEGELLSCLLQNLVCIDFKNVLDNCGHDMQ